MYRIDTFGGLRVMVGDRSLSKFSTQKAGAILASLACSSSYHCTREQLVDLYWPEHDLGAGRSNLRTALWSLRSTIQPADDTPPLLYADRTSVRLNADYLRVDLQEFYDNVQAAARASTPQDKVHFLSAAASLHRGVLLDGFYEDWVQELRASVERTYELCLDELVSLLEASGEPGRAIPFAHNRVQADCLNEQAHVVLMRLLIAANAPLRAQEQYDLLTMLLKTELNAAPGPEAAELGERLKSMRLRPRMSLLPDAPLPDAPLPHALLPDALASPRPVVNETSEASSLPADQLPTAFAPSMWGATARGQWHKRAMPPVIVTAVATFAWVAMTVFGHFGRTNKHAINDGGFAPVHGVSSGGPRRATSKHWRGKRSLAETRGDLPKSHDLASDLVAQLHFDRLLTWSNLTSRPHNSEAIIHAHMDKLDDNSPLLNRKTVEPLRDGFYAVITLAGDGSEPRSINSQGIIAGSVPVKGFDRPFIWRDYRTEIKSVPSASARGVVTCISDSQELGGRLEEEGKGLRAVLWGGSTPSLLTKEEGRFSPEGIHNRGLVVGTRERDDRPNRAFMIWHGKVTLLSCSGIASQAHSISDDLQVCGSETDEHGIVHAVYWHLGSEEHGYPELTKVCLPGLPGGTYSQVFRRGPGAVYIGEAEDANGRVRPVRWSTELKIQTLDLPSGLSSGRASSMSNQATIVGQGASFSGDFRAVVWEPGGSARDLNDLIPSESGWVLENAVDINEDGWIIGTGKLHGKPQGFLLIPFERKENQLLSISRRLHHSEADKRVAAAVCLPEPAPADQSFTLSSTPAKAIPLGGNTLTIPKGQRVGVFFIAADPIGQATNVRFRAQSPNFRAEALLTLVP